MGDYSAAWDAERARLLAAHIARTAGRLEALAGRYLELRSMLAAGSGGRPAPDAGPVRSAAGPRVPVRVEVLDILADIDRFLDELLPLVRGTLRLGTGSGVWTAGPRDGSAGAARARAGLLFLAGSLAGVYADDPGLGDAVSDGAWKLERRAGWVFGDRSRPFALAEACAACGVPSLWVVPERMAVVCANPGCGVSRPVSAAVPVHVSGG